MKHYSNIKQHAIVTSAGTVISGLSDFICIFSNGYLSQKSVCILSDFLEWPKILNLNVCKGF